MYLRIAGYMTLAGITAKLILFLSDIEQGIMVMTTLFVNLLIILLGCFFAIRNYRIDHPGSDFLSEVKSGMRPSLVFAVLMSVFAFLYYTYIDRHFFPELIESKVEMARARMETDSTINLEQIREAGEFMFSPKVHATITLFGLSITGALYSFLLVFILRRIYRVK